MAFLNLLPLVAVLAFALQPDSLRPPAGTALEYQVKAAYIFNFINFTEWPAAALGPPSSPFRICVAGRDPFRGALESTVKGEAVQGHPMVVEPLAPGESASRCQVLFVSRLTRERADELLRPISSLPILTVGESEDLLGVGGVVSFAVVQGHVRFDVNRQSALQRGLTLSSRLLRVARSVH